LQAGVDGVVDVLLEVGQRLCARRAREKERGGSALVMLRCFMRSTLSNLPFKAALVGSVPASSLRQGT
jgi:hypothetical protein